jgi:thiamine biosynthesis lipoprotein
VARTCAEADAWATALMVAGAEAGVKLAMNQRLDALILMREADGTIVPHGVGRLFSDAS